jgi:Pro-kumamolisin, activation domain/Viral BACON domain
LNGRLNIEPPQNGLARETAAWQNSLMTSTLRKTVGLAVWLAVAVPVPAQMPGRQTTSGHVPAAVARLQPMGDLPETNRLTLAVGLPLRHQAKLDRLLRDLYDPASSRYRQFLKPQEFADQFGPSEADYQALIGFAQAHHLQVLRTHSNRMLLDVSASPAEADAAFHVHIKEYRLPTEGRTFYAPDREPSLDVDVPVRHISGLDNYVLPQPALRSAVRNGHGSVPQMGTGSGPGNTFLGNDYRAVYAPGVALKGSGQSVALVEFDTYYTNDILNYESLAGIAPVPITNVLLNGFSGPPKGTDDEVSLDIELAIAMAPGLSRVMVYESPPGSVSASDDLLNQMAVDDGANQMSCSWLFPIDSVTDQIFQEMAAQGQSFFNACGDYGAYYAAMGLKEADPLITEVGGTDLLASGPGGTWVSETVWVSSSGGFSADVPIPYWQQTVNMTTNKGSTVWRNAPDVAIVGNNICVIYRNGTTNELAGTSCSAPLWAGFMALVNQQAAQYGRPPVGFLNPAIYGLGQGSLCGSCFHDIKSGNNTNSASANNYLAVAGYDLCSGWGTPNGSNLINALEPPDSLLVLPPGGLSFALTNNCAAAVETQNLILTNAGAIPITWAVGAAPAWVWFSASNGVLASGSATSLTAQTTPGAINLLAGGYAVDLVLSNLTASVAHAVPIFLAVSDPLILSPATGMAVSGPVGGPFNVTSQMISLSNAATAPIHWTVSSGSSYLIAAPGSGTLWPGQSAVVTATLSPSASNLLINAASGDLAFADATTGFTQTLPFTLAVGNGGFETGDFSDWTFAGSTNANLVGGASGFVPYVHSGAFAGIFGEPTNLATISQSVPTTPGQLYLISFWLDNPVGGNPNEFEATWNSVTLFMQTNVPKFSWTNMNFLAAASGASTTLEFLFLNKPDAFGFDDVSVTPVVPPEFSSVSASNGSVLFNWSAPPGFSCQLQYATNLAAPLWLNVGSPVLATNGAAAATDSAPVNPQRFYRVVMTLP